MITCSSISPFPIQGKQMLHDIIVFKEGLNEFAWDSGETRSVNFTKEMAQKVISKFEKQGNDLPLDFGHQTADLKPGEVPVAAGRVKSLRWEDGTGLIATLLLYEKGIRALESGNIIYHSPHFFVEEDEKGNMEVIELIAIALVDRPATVKQTPIAASKSDMEKNMPRASKKADKKEQEAVQDIAPDSQEGEPLTPEDAQDISETNGAMEQLTQTLEALGIEIPADASADDVIMLAVSQLQPTEETSEETTTEATEETAEASETVVEEKAEKADNRVSIEEFAALKSAVMDKLDSMQKQSDTVEVNALIAKYRNNNVLNKNNEKMMTAARNVATNMRAEFIELMEALSASCVLGTKTVGGVEDGRESQIIRAIAEHRDKKSNGEIIGSQKSYVNIVLGHAGEKPLSGDEVKKYIG